MSGDTALQPCREGVPSCLCLCKGEGDEKRNNGRWCVMIERGRRFSEPHFSHRHAASSRHGHGHPPGRRPQLRAGQPDGSAGGRGCVAGGYENGGVERGPAAAHPPPSPLISRPLPSSFIVTTELAAADEAAASTASTLPTLTGAASDLRKRLTKAGATLEKVEARVRRVAAAAPQPEERAAG